MTQIDLLEEELQKLEVKYISMILEYRKEKRLIFEKYKEVHKQQIIDAYKIGECEVGLMIVNKPEQYYNETYGSKGSDDHIVDTNEMVCYTEEQVREVIRNCFKSNSLGFLITEDDMMRTIKQPKND